ncbi:putative taurine catabolism dioxygenase [Cupriavidus gilardii J11]|uniref:Putative taurine catabolism dioxygenase n=1 Tax=Cupriavidus gilardii J11 TaxID=936133 RepID=A0A562BTV4_9BURK|nr:TauD/TfdA family dioxygenase [Cupriavidus gilardii]TWG88671.1 putative taurine catabolism dioxygenase [Cupriavidus gilardii J11]
MSVTPASQHRQARPQAWTAQQVREDNSWVIRLNEAQIQGMRDALAHAKALNKPLLDMVQADFPLNDVAREVLQRAIDTTQGRWGMCLVKGFPVNEWTEQEARLAYWGMSLYMGVGRTQNRASEFMNDVRNEGGEYKVKGGRGYNTNAGLDFHQDSCDVVGLLCRRTAKSGGSSKVISSIALYEEVKRRRPDLIPVLQGTWFHSYQGTQDPTQPPYYRCPIFGNHPEYFAARANRKNTVAAQRDFPEIPRLTRHQEEALDLLDELMPSELLCYSMDLEEGDLQLLNNYVTLHSRTPFEDFDEPDRKRHLFRLWLAVPGSQPLPDNWKEYFGDVRAGSVRGGVRGSAITQAFLDYEKRQAAALGMAFETWKPQVRQEDMARILAAYNAETASA